MELSSLYQYYMKCGSVSTDSRHCTPGSLFFALHGASFDGNRFAAQALADGCSFAVIDNADYLVEGDERYLLVDDTLKTLQDLARYHRRELRIPVIAITGTNGKTTTKELVAAVLSRGYNVLATEGNLNNHIGVPLTLLKISHENQIAVIEMGANHPGEIKELALIAEPDCGMITNVGKAHLEGFGSFEGVIQTKNELFDYLRTKEDAVAFVNYDNSLLCEMAHDLKCIYYGTNTSLSVSGHTANSASLLTFVWRTAEKSEYHRVFTRLIGDYNLYNALAAITIGTYFNVDDAEISKAIADYTPQNNRSQLTETSDNTLVVDAYNANPSSMMAALENFRDSRGGNKMVILGDMRELGKDSAVEHQKIVDFLQKCDCGQVILVGSEFSATKNDYLNFADTAQLIDYLKANKPVGFTILIKGSNGIKLSTITEYL